MAIGEHIGKRKVGALHTYHDGYGNNKSLGLMTFVNRPENLYLTQGSQGHRPRRHPRPHRPGS